MKFSYSLTSRIKYPVFKANRQTGKRGYFMLRIAFEFFSIPLYVLLSH